MWKSLFKKGIEAGVSCFCLLMTVTGGMGMYLSVFGGQAEWENVWTTFLIMSLVLTGWYTFGKERRIPAVLVHGGTAVAFLYAYLKNREEIFAGIKILANAVIEKWNFYYGTDLLPYDSKGTEVVAEEVTLLFVAMCIFWWETAVLLRWKKTELLLLPGMLLFLLDLLVGYVPEFKAMLLFLLGGIGIVPFNRRLERKEKKENNAAAGSFLLMAGLAFSLLLAQLLAGDYTKLASEKKMEMLAYQLKLENKVKHSSLFSLFQGKEMTVSNEKPEYQDTEVMRVTMSEAPSGSVYFRGFVGDTYDNGSWKNTSNPQELPPEIMERGIENQLYHSVGAYGTPKKVSYELQYLDFWDKYAYLPYSVDMDTIQGEKKETAAVWDSYVLRNRNQSITVEGVLPEKISYEAWLWDGGGEGRQESLDWVYEAYCEKYLAVPENLERIKKLAKRIQEEYWRPNIRMGIFDTLAATVVIRRVISNNTNYNLDLEKLPAGKDVTEYFLFESGEGFCQHYASAGVLLFREVGIPARYVTGYRISARAFTQQEDGSYQAVVLDSDAHAWSEIYLPGIGWYPEEMTKGMQSVQVRSWGEDERIGDINENRLKAAALKARENEEGLTSTEGNSEGRNPEEMNPNERNPNEINPNEINPDEMSLDEKNMKEHQDAGAEQETQGGDDLTSDTGAGENQTTVVNKDEGAGQKNRPGAAAWWKYIAVLGLVILGTGLAFLKTAGGKNLLQKRQNRIERAILKSKNPRKQVQMLAGRVYRLLRKKKIVRGRHPDDGELKELLAESGLFEPEELQAYFKVTERAAFDCGEISREEFLCCYRFYQKVKVLK